MENPNIWNTAIKTALAGGWAGSLDLFGYFGNYWLSVVYGNTAAYNLGVYYDGGVDPSSNSGRNYGFSVRCVAR